MQRRTPFALANLLAQPARTLISVGGVAFAVLLMLMQLGFLGTIQDTATLVYDRVPFSIVIRSPEYLHLYESRSISADLWRQAAQVPGVADTRLLDVAVGDWHNEFDGKTRGMAMIGIDPALPAINLPGLDAQLPLLSRADVVLIDQASRPEFGPLNRNAFGSADIGRTTTVLGKSVVIGGTYFLGTGLAANGALIINRHGFAERVPGHQGQVSLILLTVAPNFKPSKVAEDIRHALRKAGYEKSANVMLREQVLSYELKRWVWDTPIGLIFVSGVLLAVLVGAMVCYMVLATDVMGRLSEYATLKAIGYHDSYLAMVVIQQAWYLAGFAFVVTVPVAIGVYRLTSHLAGISIQMTFWRLVLVAGLTFGACTIAALVAMRKLTELNLRHYFKFGGSND